MSKQINNLLGRRSVTATALRRDFANIVQDVQASNQAVVVTVASCPRLAIVDLKQYEELCYRAYPMRQ